MGSDDKKRKRSGDATSKPKKKVVVDASSPTATVSSVLRPKFCPPVIATAVGFEVPKNIPFHAYAPNNATKSKSKQPQSAGEKDFLLHSNAHRTMDYTVKAEGPRGEKPALNHFLGIYDPKTGKLEVVEAKKMTMRASVRARQGAAATSNERDMKQTMSALKTDLGQTFGTKKAKKAIQENVLNAIAPQKKAGDAPTKIDAAGRAILSSVGEITSTMASREELQAVVDEAKPVPMANLEATEIQDVYDPKNIIGEDILKLVPVREWQEKVQHKESIQVPSRFVAARVNRVAGNEEAVDRLRVLRYFFFVLLFYLHTKPGKARGTRAIPPREKLRELLAPAPEAVIESIRRKFSDRGEMRKFHMDLLMTHCCVFASIIDNFEVDTQNLRDDLKIDQKTMNAYFHEIGGRVKPVTNKDTKTTVHLARLVLPLSFPKQRHVVPKRR
ncbi:DNA-directed RNA polymerase A (I) chain [Fusarium heterosporum]|uniref:DNA-directed RNA polymerase A (I) chain n=1 Tax=Fusarium heterosporum TaxID=42747 RepID=A0A8H5U4Z1_FUSHE|nr:DNA-directed RNA polymerase A (I) chain [Fusarium heterosporum]